MRYFVLAPLLIALSVHPAAAQGEVGLDDSNSASIPLPTLGGWVLSPDGETLIVSSPQTAEIIYINTSEDKEVKRVKVDFQPSALALRGPSLFALGKGQGDDRKRSYVIGVFDTDDLETQLGQVETGPYPSDICFHPALDLGAAERSGGLLILFNGRSLAPIKSMGVTTKGATISEFKLMTFGGRGTKLVYYQAASKSPARSSRTRPGSPTTSTTGPESEGKLYLIPLELTDEQKAELAKAFPAAKG